ncbi:MAG TPA: DUF5985 family protein [Rhizomicrobium sp.]|jgi:hypothetical protein|nr:DUF5985 family protein [Rhizomicrobium sp.]
MMTALYFVLSGAVSACFLIAALFFMRFWVRTRDRFFLLFSVAFAIYAINQFVVGLASRSDFEPLFYLPRLATFGLIVLAVINKNRPDDGR